MLCTKNRARCGQGEAFKHSISKLIHWHLCIEELQADSPEKSSALLVLWFWKSSLSQCQLQIKWDLAFMLLVNDKRKLKLSCKFHIRSILHKIKLSFCPAQQKHLVLIIFSACEKIKTAYWNTLKRFLDTKILTNGPYSSITHNLYSTE